MFSAFLFSFSFSLFVVAIDLGCRSSYTFLLHLFVLLNIVLFVEGIVRNGKFQESFMRALDEQDNLIAELKRRVVVLEAELAEEKARRTNKDDDGQSVPHAEHFMNNGFVSPGGMSTNPPPMKTYVGSDHEGVTKVERLGLLEMDYLE
ncbi:hypothetical protein LR48_Vigan07g221700 [Vigna angularis]|uniref:Uncharacterized protein n=1 Tax=Phaseolus angularis TaxID=3914 RepID=A0A0L9V0G8_PHAAN|nr:hypothetical protein LR48_Vigan07g221700 [Vigna angularis]